MDIENNRIEEEKLLELREKLRIIRASKAKNIIVTSGLAIITYTTVKEVQVDPSIIHWIDLFTASAFTVISGGYTLDKCYKSLKEENRLVKILKNK